MIMILEQYEQQQVFLPIQSNGQACGFKNMLCLKSTSHQANYPIHSNNMQSFNQHIFVSFKTISSVSAKFECVCYFADNMIDSIDIQEILIDSCVWSN